MNLVERAKRIMVSPATEWPVIASESTPAQTLITGYVVPLAAVAAISGFIGTVVVGVSLPMLPTYRVPVAAGLVSLVWSIVAAVIGVFVCAYIINALAQSFDSQKSDAQALKLAAYAFTPAWIAGILQIIPALGVLAILGALYGIYLMYLGLPVLMRTPPDKAIGYTAIVVIATIVVMFVIGAVGALLLGMVTPGPVY